MEQNPDTYDRLRRVIVKTLELIPDDFQNAKELRKEIVELRDGLAYTAPELKSERWRAFGFVLQHHIGPPAQYEWAREIVKLMSGETPC